MACSCGKRNITKQTVRKTPVRQTAQRLSSGKRILRKVIK